VVAEAQLDPAAGLVGDCWRERGSRATDDGSAHPDMQLTMMGARAAALIAGNHERWPLAGDQLYVDLDLSVGNMPPGTRVEIGAAILEVSGAPHRGCKKFAARYGLDALRFVNSKTGYALNLRGVNTRVVRGGVVRAGDTVRKLPSVR
jgi:MOSC domain-containing protein YiiM